MKGAVSNNTISILEGDITKLSVGAYIVPQFDSEASTGGVGGAIIRAGGEAGIKLFQEHVDKNGKQEFGSVLITESGGAKAKSLLHVVTVGSGEEKEFEVVKTAFLNALKAAEKAGITSIAAPALGTGIIGTLTGEQSAKAMLSALNEYAKQGGKPIEISFTIYNDKATYEAFTKVLETKSYENAVSEKGVKQFDAAKFQAEMTEHNKGEKVESALAKIPQVGDLAVDAELITKEERDLVLARIKEKKALHEKDASNPKPGFFLDEAKQIKRENGTLLLNAEQAEEILALQIKRKADAALLDMQKLIEGKKLDLSKKPHWGNGPADSPVNPAIDKPSRIEAASAAANRAELIVLLTSQKPEILQVEPIAQLMYGGVIAARNNAMLILSESNIEVSSKALAFAAKINGVDDGIVDAYNKNRGLEVAKGIEDSQVMQWTKKLEAQKSQEPQNQGLASRG